MGFPAVKEMDTEREWTTGNDAAVSHQRRIASGGAGEVHEVRSGMG
jgi:hypothetical protein